MRKIVLSFMLLSAMLLCSCTVDSTTADITAPPTEIDTTTAITTTPPVETQMVTSAKATTYVTTANEKTDYQVSEANLWITIEYADDIERISAFANKKLLEYYDFMEDEFIPEIPDVYLLISDMNFDGSPEIITGHSIKYREQKHYELFSYRLEPQNIIFLIPETYTLFDSKVYVDNFGRKYYYTSIFSGSAGDIWYLYTQIWFEHEKWVLKSEQSKLEKPTDKYDDILISSVTISPDDIKGSVEQCFIEYYSQLYDEDGNRLAQ